MNALVVRSATIAEFAAAIEWAASEGWNPGACDLDAFHATDPEGFIMGFLGSEPVSSISVVRYGSKFGFLGFYIVDPQHRGKGFGLATWQAGLAHLAGRTIGLDGVVDQQENYRRSGFSYSGRNVRYTGVPVLEDREMSNVAVRDFQPADLEAVAALDRMVFPAERLGFLKRWMDAPQGSGRKSVIAEIGGELLGYGTIRKCRSGWKIGPLVAAEGPIANHLFNALCRTVPTGDPVTLDAPETNAAATRMAQAAGLSPVFETARMYLGPISPVRQELLFGITSFELG